MERSEDGILLKSTSTELILLRVFLYNHLLPLCGVTSDQIKVCKVYYNDPNGEDLAEKLESDLEEDKDAIIDDYCVPIKIKEKILGFLKPLEFQKNNDYVEKIFYTGIEIFYNLVNINLSSIPEFFWFKPSKSIKKYNAFDMNEPKSIFYENMFKMAIEKTICKFLCISDKKTANMEKLLFILDEWSKKTYEGHHVCYGFLISERRNQSNIKIPNHVENFLSFLEDEYSAVISDGMTSLFKIDTNCNFLGFASVTDMYNC